MLVVEKLRSPVDKGPERVESIAGDVQTLTGGCACVTDTRGENHFLPFQDMIGIQFGLVASVSVFK